jgi:hypothetical protein
VVTAQKNQKKEAEERPSEMGNFEGQCKVMYQWIVEMIGGEAECTFEDDATVARPLFSLSLLLFGI